MYSTSDVGDCRRARHFVSNFVSKKVGILSIVLGLLLVAACAPQPVTTQPDQPSPTPDQPSSPPNQQVAVDSDPREGLAPGLFDAEEAIWNLRVLSQTPPAEDFVGMTNSDLAFKDNYVIQGNYNGIQIWDVSDATNPVLVEGYVCPASQSDVSVYGNLLFVSGEGLEARLDCGTEGVRERVSEERLRGIRIFDISDIHNPEYIHNVQTCRGSHTHSVLVDPDDDENVYVYVSGSAPVRPEEELPGCVSAPPEEDPNSALFRIEVIRVPLDNPQEAAIVSSPRLFEGLVEPEEHGPAPADLDAVEDAREGGSFVIELGGQPHELPDQIVSRLLERMVEEREGEGEPTAADSTALRQMLTEQFAAQDDDEAPGRGPTQCHDITLYPEIGLAGGACEGYGLLLDITDPVNPTRIDAVADTNFAYWHSATFSNDGSKVLFTDEWGGGTQPKCRPTDPREWGANALFTIEDGEMEFESYYKLPASQTPLENCVAHNGSLIPIPGREVMVQAWYQGGISIFDWTNPENPVEIAFHDRGPVNPEQLEMAGSWSVYWYNGLIVSSEIARGLDIFELVPSEYLTDNEIAAARTVELEYLNAQGQPHFEWPATFALARAYVDQLDRSDGLSDERIASIRQALDRAEAASGSSRGEMLDDLASSVESDAAGSVEAEKVRMLADAVRDLATS